MDYNDIKSRLERVHSSIASKFDESYEHHLNINHSVTDDGKKHTSVSFDKKGKSDSLNKLISIIHNLANIKDHAKNKLHSVGGDRKNIEQEINNSNWIQIVLDISNQEKHGSPTKINHSQKRPRITNVESWLISTTNGEIGSTAGFVMNANGETQFLGNNKVDIEADIVDESGQLICTIDELITGAINDWNRVLQKFHLLKSLLLNHTCFSRKGL